MKTIFITATGTEIGKTFVTAALAHQLKEQGKNIRVLKPIITGWEDDSNDTKTLLTAAGLPTTQANIEATSPWRFKAPLAADMAADRENREINFDEIVEFCAQKFDGIKLIEGAGGVMSPVTNGKTFLDVINAIDCEVILVTGSYLGAISHTLTALQILSKHKTSVIINETPSSPVSLAETKKSISQFTDAPIITLPRCKNHQSVYNFHNIVIPA